MQPFHYPQGPYRPAARQERHRKDLKPSAQAPVQRLRAGSVQAADYCTLDSSHCERLLHTAGKARLRITNVDATAV